MTEGALILNFSAWRARPFGVKSSLACLGGDNFKEGCGFFLALPVVFRDTGNASGRDRYSLTRWGGLISPDFVSDGLRGFIGRWIHLMSSESRNSMYSFGAVDRHSLREFLNLCRSPDDASSRSGV
jgi:hypothetical protein